MPIPTETQPDEISDDELLAQARRDHEEARKKQQREQTSSLLGIIGQRHKVRENLIKEGRLAEVLCADAALDEKVSDVEDIVQASLLKSGVSEPIAELTRTLVSGLGRMLLGLGPSQHDMIETSRKLFGVERTPEEKAANQTRLMEKLERLKVKPEDKSAQERPCRDTCPWCGGPADESCCDGLDGECPGAILRCRALSCRWVCHCSTLAVEYSGRDAEGRDEVERCAPSNCDQRGTVQECASGWKCWGCGRLQETRAWEDMRMCGGIDKATGVKL